MIHKTFDCTSMRVMKIYIKNSGQVKSTLWLQCKKCSNIKYCKKVIGDQSRFCTGLFPQDPEKMFRNL